MPSLAAAHLVFVRPHVAACAETVSGNRSSGGRCGYAVCNILARRISYRGIVLFRGKFALHRSSSAHRIFPGITTRLRAPAFLGGLIALDVWLICFEWLLLHSTTGDSMAWLIYWAASLPVGIVGMLFGIALVSLTRRFSLHRKKLEGRNVGECSQMRSLEPGLNFWLVRPSPMEGDGN